MALALKILTVCSLGLSSTSCGGADPFAAGAHVDPDPDVVIVGSAAFPESEVVAEIYAQALRANGFKAGGKHGVGSREGYLPALRTGELDLMPEYTGNLLQFLRKDTKATTAEQIKADLEQSLGGIGIIAYAPAPASDADAVVVTKKLALTWGLKSIADLVPHAGEVKLAANSEFQQRGPGLIGLKEKYGLDITPDRFVAINDSSGPATIKALRENRVQAANLYTTTPALAGGDLVVLGDPLGVFPPNNVVPVVGKHKDSVKLRRVLDAASAQLTTEELTALNQAVAGDGGKQEPEEAAAAWLAAHQLDKPLPPA